MLLDVLEAGDFDAIAKAFHAEHNRMYGYSLEDQVTAIEVINIRLQSIGITGKPPFREEHYAGEDASAALKGERRIYVPEADQFQTALVYDGHATRFGYHITGPALIEQVNTAILVTAGFD